MWDILCNVGCLCKLAACSVLRRTEQHVVVYSSSAARVAYLKPVLPMGQNAVYHQDVFALPVSANVLRGASRGRGAGHAISNGQSAGGSGTSRVTSVVGDA